MASSGVHPAQGAVSAASASTFVNASQRRAIITSAGLCTALGSTLQQTWDALCKHRFITDHAHADIVATPDEARIITLARQAVADAGAGATHTAPHDARTALIVGTSKGPVEDWLAPQPPSSIASLDGWGLSSVAARLARSLDISGPRLTVSAACASGIHALFFAKMLIQSGEVDRALVVAAEASVHPLFIGSFQRLGVLARGGTGCRPMDRDRNGFLMSEAAAALWISAADVLPPAREDDPGAPLRVAVGETLIAGDAEHLTRSDEQAHALRRLLRQSGERAAFDLIHAHATGTIANDATELAAIDAELGNPASPPNVFSHKAGLGHSLGAAGLVSVVLNWKAHQTGIVPPNVRTTQPLASTGLLISSDAARRPIRKSIAIAAGFGGALGVASLLTLE